MLSTIVSPHLFPRPNIDQGVYTYIGNEILEGKLPYRDLWDHKGFLVYYIYAIGLMIHSHYGIWLIGLIILWLTVGISYKFYYDMFGHHEAFVWTLIWLISLKSVLDGGSTIEFFNLPLLFAGMYCTFLLYKTRNFLFAFCIGCLGGISFFLRPNELGVFIPACLICLFYVIKNFRQAGFWLNSLIYMGIGFFIITTLFLLFLYFQGTLTDFYDAVIRFNLLYSQGNSNKFVAWFFGVYLLPTLFIVAFTSWIFLIINKEWKEAYIEKGFSYFLVISFPIQVLLSIMSGRAYAHYYISWLPVITILVAFGAKPLRDILKRFNPRYTNLFWVVISFLMIVFSIWSLRKPFTSFVSPILSTGSMPALDAKNNPDHVYVSYVTNNTIDTDYVWFWGNQVIFNVQANRKTPSRFIYPYPFSIPNYANTLLVNETINELKMNKPALIIDPTTDDFPPVDSLNWANHEIVLPLIHYILENYMIIEYIGAEEWIVWSPK